MSERTGTPAVAAPPAVALAAVLFGLGLGLAAWGGWGALTTRLGHEAFCLSCHEPNVGIGEQARLSHLSNRTGIRAQCPDCHTGRSWTDRLAFVARHARDVTGFFGHLTDTPEQQDAHRLSVASRVWAEMEADGSAGCRSCHGPAAMDRSKFSADAAREMQERPVPGASCITCHKGILHPAPTVTAEWFTRSLADLAAAGHPAPGSRVIAVASHKLFLQPAATAGSHGSVLPGAEMDVLEAAAGRLRVRISGWQQETAPRAVYAAMGQRILTAALAPAAVQAATTGAVATDPITGIVWQRTTLEAWIDATGLATSADAVWAVVATSYAALCASCHALPRPSVHTANQWIGTMSGKRKLLPLDDDGNRLLLRYVQLHAETSSHER
jgi:trimethylamine-N-oxide reductase cytochrome c-type subunit TorC